MKTLSERGVLRRALVIVSLVVLGALGLAAPTTGAPATFWSVPCTTAVALVTTAETVVCTLVGVTASAGQIIRLMAVTQVTTGTGTTAVTLRLRRGSATTGILLGPANPVQATAGNTVQLAAAAEDTSIEAAFQPYVLTVQQTAAAANGSVLFTELIAFVF